MDKYFVRDGNEHYIPEEVESVEKYSKQEMDRKIRKLIRDFETAEFLKSKETERS